jgi:VWFA-related protein
MSKRMTLFCSMWLAALFPRPMHAQMDQSKADSPAVIRATTRLVQVDVVVTDSSGHLVKDLSESDFSITENGKSQKVAFFSFVGQQLSGQIQRTGTQLPPHVATNRPEWRPLGGPPIVLLLDGINTQVENQLQVRKQMLSFLAEHFDPSMRVAVFAMGNELTVLQDFTSDPTLLRRAMEKYRSQAAAAGRQGSTDLNLTPPTADAGPNSSRATVQPGAGAADGGTDRSLANIAYALARFEKETTASTLELRIGHTVDALAAIARYLSGFPGRKVIIWFSGSFPFNLSIVDAPDQDVYRSYGEQIHRATNLLSDAQVAVYTVDARGLTGTSLADPSQTGRDANGRMQLTVNDHMLANGKETFARFNEEDSLIKFAQETGGRSFLNTNDLTQAITAGIEDSAASYVVGYYPYEKKWDGSFRNIKVKVSRNGLSVRHRRGYYAIDPEKWRRGNSANDMKMALAQGTVDSTSVLFYARALPPAANNEVRVEFLVDPHTVSFETTSEGQHYCNLEFQVQAFGDDGKQIAAEVQQAEAPLRPETYQRIQKSGLPMPVSIRLPAGKYSLHLGVRDNRTGLFGTTELPLIVGGRSK